MDRIVYVLVSTGGGVDGLDHTDKGGQDLEAFFDIESAEKSPKYHYAKIEKRVVEFDDARKEAIAKLNPIDKLVLGVGAPKMTHRQ